MNTSYQSQYFSHERVKRCSTGSLEKPTGTLMDAQVDLNPHRLSRAKCNNHTFSLIGNPTAAGKINI